MRRSSLYLAGLLAVDSAGAVTAWRHHIAGEPLGFGARFGVRPASLMFWGSGLSAPFASLVAALWCARRHVGALRVLGAMFALGATIEPVLWGRRPCPRYARGLLGVHIALGTALATGR